MISEYTSLKMEIVEYSHNYQKGKKKFNKYFCSGEKAKSYIYVTGWGKPFSVSIVTRG